VTTRGPASHGKASVVVLNGSLVWNPESGGHWAWLMQYLLGLLDLGHRVTWLELMSSTGNPERDRTMAEAFFDRLRPLGVAGSAVVAVAPPGEEDLAAARTFGESADRILRICRSADVAWNMACAAPKGVLSLFRRRALLDVDPGHLQVSMLDFDMNLSEHEVLFTVGQRMGREGCRAPTLGRHWHTYLPIVHLPAWPDAGPAPASAPFSSLSHWNWGELWLEGEVLSISKREAFLHYAAVPRRTGRPFRLATAIDPVDAAGDRSTLEENGWEISDPGCVASDIDSYRAFIGASRAEISCAKPIFRELRTGWLSDRSAAYLASGRPVLAEDTGFSDLLPVGRGLVVFADPDEAVAGVRAIDGDYDAHRAAARQLAADYLDSRRTLTRMVELSAW
jgi:hypothetical protein